MTEPNTVEMNLALPSGLGVRHVFLQAPGGEVALAEMMFDIGAIPKTPMPSVCGLTLAEAKNKLLLFHVETLKLSLRMYHMDLMELYEALYELDHGRDARGDGEGPDPEQDGDDCCVTGDACIEGGEACGCCDCDCLRCYGEPCFGIRDDSDDEGGEGSK